MAPENGDKITVAGCLRSLIILAVVGFVAVKCLENEDKSGHRRTTSSGHCTTVKDQIFAVDKASFDKAARLLVDRDFAAFNMLRATGRVGVFKGGQRVYLVSAGIMRHTFRMPGNTATLWTAAEGLRCR